MRLLLLPSFVVAVCLPAASVAQTTFSWTGSSSGAWSAASNWNPSAGSPPGTSATDIASFDSVSANDEIALGSATTIGNLQFLSGSGAYAFSGSALTIATSGTFITNNSAAHQSFANTVVLQGDDSKTISVGAGSSLSFASLDFAGQTTRRNLTVSGGGTVTVNAVGSSSPNRINQLVVDSDTIVNWHVASNSASNDYRVSGRLNLFNNVGTTGISVRLQSADSEAYLSSSGLNFNVANLEFRQGNGNTATFGADIAGGGTATRSGDIKLNASASLTNATHRLYAAADNTFVVTGSILDTNASGSGTKIEIAGAGLVRFSGTVANTSVTPISIASGATLELAKTEGVNAIAGGSVTVNTDGELRLAASHQIADSVSLSLAGGTFNAASFTESLGALDVTAAGGEIEFGGSAGSLTFSSLSSITGTLTVTGWSDSASIVFTDGSAWDSTALSRVVFTGYGAAQFDALTGELYASAIPEPSSAAALVAALALGLGCARRRRSC